MRKVEERQLEEMEDDGEEEDVLVVMEDEGEENEVEQNREEGGSDEKIKLVADEKLGVGKEANEEEERRVKQEVEERKVFMAGEDDDVIERVIRQARVVRPLPNQPRVGEVHLLMGDSIARVYPFTVREPDRILNLAEGGMTFRRLADKVEENLTYWHMQLKDWEVKGKVVLWLGGNDVYQRRGGRPRRLPTEAVSAVINALLEKMPPTNIVVLGPTPRQTDARWETSHAYHAEAALVDIIQKLDARIEVVRDLGRALGDRNHRMTRPGVFCRDGVHLTALGYNRVSIRMPAWLK